MHDQHLPLSTFKILKRIVVYDETLITTQVFCGQCSSRGSTLISGNTKSGHLSLFCLSNSQSTCHINEFRAIQINGDTSTTLWPTISFLPIVDHQWHYTCVDIRSRLVSQSSISSSVRLFSHSSSMAQL